jgi:phosphoribosylamine--glycine ligase
VRAVRVLVVGGGGREHALAWRLRRCPSVREVLAAPGNPGMAPVARCLPVAADDPAGLAELCRREGVDLVVVGPEAPLVAGLADRLRWAGLTVLGPSAAAARIEGSKGWAKELCRRYGIPAPAAVACAEPAEALAYARTCPLPVAVKADGLMAGKGVVLAHTREEALRAAGTLSARGPVVFEEHLRGREVSAFALSDGERWVLYGVARDHKRLLDGDRGPMTGGMGAFSPVPDVSPAEEAAIRGILSSALRALAAEGCPFVGFLFAGLMLTADGPKVLEFNCRLGDPEAQCLLPRLEGDVAEQWWRAARGGLRAGEAVAWRPEYALGVVLATPGYPEAPRPGQEIPGLGTDGQLPGPAVIFHAATARDGAWRTAGGRVLTAVGLGDDLAAARARAYAAAEALAFPGAQWRRDIGLG